MSIVIIGANGQLGKTLQTVLSSTDLTLLGRSELDLETTDPMEQLQTLKPDVVINAAAYTAVDKAESDQEKADRINHISAGNLAKACKATGTYLIHISTDFVFDGKSNRPYTVDSQCNPLGVYGITKRNGEKAILEAYPENSCIIRTAWLYSSSQGNFVTSMLRLMAERSELGIVTDQVGSPTSTETLALFIKAATEQRLSGLYHWTDAGVASWYDFSVAIYEEAKNAGLLKNHVLIKPIFSKDYPTPARRPHYSVLDKSKSYADTNMIASHWRTPLRRVIQQIAKREPSIG